VTDPVPRPRHSPGKTQQESTRGATELAYEAECGAREASRCVPLRQGLHALCQGGAVAKLRPKTVSAAHVSIAGEVGKARGIKTLQNLLQRLSLEDRIVKDRVMERDTTILFRLWETNLDESFNSEHPVISIRQVTAPCSDWPQVDTLPAGLNNPRMPRPEAVRRVKSYSAATGYVYQYYFYEVEKSHRGAAEGTEYVYMASVDRKHVFPVKIFVAKDGIKQWSERTGRQLTGTEEYAVAKMRLFQAFDEVEGFPEKVPDLTVDSSNLDSLLSQLDL